MATIAAEFECQRLQFRWPPILAGTCGSLRLAHPRELMSFLGSWIPFAINKDERDPRLSIGQRYASEQVYLERIDRAAKDLVTSGFLLEADLGSIHDRAAKEWEYRQSVH